MAVNSLGTAIKHFIRTGRPFVDHHFWHFDRNGDIVIIIIGRIVALIVQVRNHTSDGAICMNFCEQYESNLQPLQMIMVLSRKAISSGKMK